MEWRWESNDPGGLERLSERLWQGGESAERQQEIAPLFSVDPRSFGRHGFFALFGGAIGHKQHTLSFIPLLQIIERSLRRGVYGADLSDTHLKHEGPYLIRAKGLKRRGRSEMGLGYGRFKKELRLGEVAEWLKAHAWKACLGETLT